jgi:hypothetical protein
LPGAQRGTIYWGQNGPTEGWWDHLAELDGSQKVIRAPDEDESGFYYFWTDAISEFFPWPISDYVREDWFEPWIPDAPQF